MNLYSLSLFRPGRISDSLREALGIGRYDIPEWIYRMRDKGFIDGYPPGYLAEVIYLFNSFLTGICVARREWDSNQWLSDLSDINYCLPK